MLPGVAEVTSPAQTSDRRRSTCSRGRGQGAETWQQRKQRNSFHGLQLVAAAAAEQNMVGAVNSKSGWCTVAGVQWLVAPRVLVAPVAAVAACSAAALLLLRAGRAYIYIYIIWQATVTRRYGGPVVGHDCKFQIFPDVSVIAFSGSSLAITTEYNSKRPATVAVTAPIH